MGVEYLWNVIERGRRKYSEKNLSQCHSCDHMSDMN
jgi:hypothetical protein